MTTQTSKLDLEIMLDDTRKSNIAPYRKNYSIFLIKIDFIRPIFDDLHRPNYPTPLYTNYLKVVVSEISHKLEITSFPEKIQELEKHQKAEKVPNRALSILNPLPDECASRCRMNLVVPVKYSTRFTLSRFILSFLLETDCRVH